MSDFLQDTPFVAVSYCPGCEPERDPVAEVLDTRWCIFHTPPVRGDVDDAITAQSFLSNTDAGGDDNRAWCDLLHRGRR